MFSLGEDVKRFLEFLNDKNFNQVKTIVLDILDPEQSLNDDSDILTHELSDFKNRDNLLTDPALKSIIDRSDNQEAIYAAVANNSTTIGNLLALLNGE